MPHIARWKRALPLTIRFSKQKCMEEKTTWDRVKDVIIDVLGVTEDQIKPEASLVEDLGADSLDVVEIIIALEEEFAITLEDEVSEKIETVEEIVTAIDGLIA
jgi:acyl carrier protein